MPTDQELVNRAFRAYFRRYGKDADQPSSSRSTVDGDTVVVENARRVLARYRVRDNKLCFVSPS